MGVGGVRWRGCANECGVRGGDRDTQTGGEVRRGQLHLDYAGLVGGCRWQDTQMGGGCAQGCGVRRAVGCGAAGEVRDRGAQGYAGGGAGYVNGWGVRRGAGAGGGVRKWVGGCAGGQLHLDYAGLVGGCGWQGAQGAGCARRGVLGGGGGAGRQQGCAGVWVRRGGYLSW